MRSFMAKSAEVEPKWFVVDGTDQVLGRLAARIATVLMGKHQPTYTPHVDTGDHVIVVNAAKVRIAPPKKQRTRNITYHTGYIGGLKQIPLPEAFERNPAKVVSLAVRRMLPKSKLGRRMFSKLKVYAGPEHPHAAQQPQPFPERI